MAVFLNGEIFYSAVIPVGGNHVTNDVAYGLTVGRDEAERLKTESGSALLELVPEEDVIPSSRSDATKSRKLRRSALVQIIEPRMQELFEMVQDELEKAECLGHIPAGLVISGGGSQLQGCLEVAQQVMDMPVRIGSPQGVGGSGETLTHPRMRPRSAWSSTARNRFRQIAPSGATRRVRAELSPCCSDCSTGCVTASSTH